MPEPIGKEITQKWVEAKQVEKQASQFRILDFRVEPPSHVIKAEVCLYDDAGEAVGPARWVQINPLVDSKGEKIDNWAALVNMTLKEINAKVKARLQTWGAEKSAVKT